MEKHSFYQQQLSQINEWVRFSDTKIAFLAVLYGALLPFILVHFEKMNAISNPYIKSGIVFFAVLSAFYTVYHLVKGVIPRISNTSSIDPVFFFGYIASQKQSNYITKMIGFTDDQVLEAILEQIHTNSLIASTKMQHAKQMSFGVIAMVLVSVIAFFL